MTTVDAADSAAFPTAPSPARSTADVVRSAAGAQIQRLQNGFLSDLPSAVAAVARIRRGAGKPIDAVPDLWGMTVTDTLYEQLEQLDTTVSKMASERAENAVHIAVTLWALHQQSRHDAPMHRAGGPQLGGAVRALMPAGEIDEMLRRRFVRVGTATSLDILAQRAREIVQLLRQQAQPMDYGMFAGQIYRWQVPGGRLKVHQEWGRSFHANRRTAANPPAVSESDKEA